MTARASQFPGPGYRLRIPATLWSTAVATLRAYRALDSEGLAYLGGVVCGADEVAVTSVIRIGHAPQGDAVRVTGSESRWLVRTLRARDEKLIAQMHSHRGGAHHSGDDDAHATSFHDGFLSIVVPRFGRGSDGPATTRFYEIRGGEFVPVGGKELERRVSLVAEVVDLRPFAVERRPLWKVFVQKVKRIGRKQP
jgi:hypothetical protein